MFNYILIPLIIFYLYSPAKIENIIFINELLSGLGFFVFTINLLKKYTIKSKAEILFLSLLLYITIRIVISLLFYDSLYIYLRHMVMWYSMFGFFIGQEIYNSKLLPKLLKSLGFILIIFAPFVNIINVLQTNIAIFFSQIFPRRKLYSTLFFIFTIILMINFFSSTTPIISFFAAYMFLIANKVKYQYLILLTVFISTGLILFLLHPIIDASYNNSLWQESMVYASDELGAGGGNIDATGIMSSSSNLLPRISLWHQVLIASFPQNFIGVGIGTLLFPYPMLVPPPADPSYMSIHMYIIGAHNSFISFFGRFGLLYIFLHLYIYKEILHEFSLYRVFYQDQGKYNYFLIFIACSVMAFFNPTLLTPMHAVFYWISLGLVVGSINFRMQSMKIK